MFVVVNTIEGTEESLAATAENFRRAMSSLTGFEGLLGFELWRRAGALLAVSRWASREAFLTYPKSELFKAHHKGRGAEELEGVAKLSTYEAEILC